MEFFHLVCGILLQFSVLLCFISFVLGSLRPRGVSLSKKVFYNPSQRFSCLDGSGTYPFYFVNDDYCDCPDGSDEPGTSACPNGLFYCFNLGYKSTNIPSSRVNDEICDCCDTSDEYNSTADCFNNCKELGHHALHNALTFYKYFIQGQEIRENYIKSGKEKKDQYKVQFETLKQKENIAKILKLKKQDIKEKCEERENMYLGWHKEMKEVQEKKIAAEKVRLLKQQHQEVIEAKLAFEELDVNRDGKLHVTELKSFPRFDYDLDGTVSDKEAKFYMHKKEEMTLQEFLLNGWKIMKPAFIIEQTSGEVLDSDITKKETAVKVSNNACKRVPDSNIRNSCKQSNKMSVNVEESVAEPLTDSPYSDLKDKDSIFKEAAIARKEFAEAIKILQDIEAEKWNIKRKLEADFGAEDEFLVLENQCFDLSDKRYLYKFCPFDKVVQLQRPSNQETLVGLWDKWSGPKDNIYAQMKFTRGNICWNGPNRSAEVNLRCGVENKLLSVEELSPCSYLLEFSTPAACQNLPSHIQETLDRGNIVTV